MAAMPPDMLDVRPIAPQRTPPTVVATYEKLAPGESFVLVTDREPTAVRATLEAQAAHGTGWEYLEAGPDVWRVRITRW
jgi:uncharacterized protein (DUF2249 family)